MFKHLLLALTAIILFAGEAMSQCNITASISLASGTNVCANAATLTALPKSDNWLQKASFGGSTRDYPCGFNIGNKGYIGLGNSQDDFWEYDPATNVWTQKANYPNSSSSYHLGFSIGSKGYVAGATFLSEVFYEYDPSTNTWTSKATPGGGTRLAGFVFSIGNKGYIGSGATNLLVAKNDFWEYTPTTNTWTQKANFGGGARYNAVGVGTSSLGYAGMGVNTLILGQNDWWEYDPTADAWTQKTTYPGSNYYPRNVGFNINGKPYVVESTTTFGTNFFEYSPATDTWSTMASYPGSSLPKAAGFSIGSKGYMGGGTAASDFWEYTSPLTYSWSTGAVTQTISASGSGSYAVTITDVLSCTSTATRSMNINPLPNLNVSGANVCNGKTTTLTASGATSYTWSSNVGGGNASTAVVTPSANTFYTISATGPGPCTVSAVKALVLVANPSATITTSGATSICGTSIALTAAPTGNTWTTKANVGGSARWRGVGVSIGSKGYVGLGLNSSFTPQNDFWEYDPSSNSWTQKANAPMAGSSGLAFSIGNKAYIGMGFNTDFYEYDPSSNTWTQKTSFPGTGVNLSEGIAFSAASRGYMGLGTTTMNIRTDEIWEYEPVSNTWTKRSNFPPGGRSAAYALGIGSKGYIGGGYDNGFFNYGDHWEYTPSTDSWLQKASWPGSFAPMYAKSFQINNKGYFSPGSGFFHQYDPSTDTWTQKPSMPGGSLIYEIAFSIGDKGYSGTGSSGGSYTNNFYEYDPEETFLWSTSAITNTVGVTSTGSYSVIVTSALGCSATAVKAVTVNPIPVITSTASSPVICIGGTTSLSGGGASTYVWTGGVTNGIAFSPTTTLTYTVTGTAATGCTNTAVNTITVNSLPTVSSTTSNSVICLGGSTSLRGTGATTYTWSNSVTNGATFSPTITLTYTVTGTNSANGCTNTAVRTITVNSLPSVTANATPSVVCLNGSLTLSGAGASTYTWSGGVTNGVAFAPSVSGTYTVTGTSAQNCTNTATRSITVNSLPVVTASSSNSVICNGASTSLNGGGATSYVWSNSVANGTTFSPTVTASYTVTGTDANTCTNTAVTTITVNNLPSVTANASSTAICIGGTVSLSGGGATTYTWAGGIINGSAFSPTLSATYTVTGTDANTCTNTAVRTITVNALPVVGATASPSVICLNKTTTLNGTGASTYTWTSGVTNGVAFTPGGTATYTVTGTSALNCTNTAAITVTVNNLPTVAASSSNSIICIGATTSLNGGGANTYTWSNSVANGTPFSPTLTASYTVTGTDANTCTNSAVTTITVNNLPTISANASSNPICIGGTVSLTGGGATTYTWTGGVLNATAFSPTITTSYTVTGTDANTCTNTSVRTITVNALPVVGATASPSVICLNKTTTLNGTGATTYTWTSSVTNGVSFTPGGTATYTVTGTSALNCTNTAVVTVTVNSLPNVSSVISNPAVCIGGTTSVSGAGASTYTWTNGLTDGGVFSPTITATYTVTGTDVNTCTNTALATVTVNALPTVIANASNSVICIGAQVTLSGSGASTYIWSNGVTNGTPFSPTLTAAYTVTGTAASTGCTNTAVRTITVNSLPVVTANASQTVICLNNTVTLTGGGASTYVWSNGVTNGVAFAPGSTTTYTVIGTSALNCTNTAIKTITVNNLPIITANSTNPVICVGGTTTLFGLGGVTYTWTSGVVNASVISPTTTTSYTVTGTDANTCTNTAVTNIVVNAKPIVTANASSTAICIGNTVTVFGGGATTYTWSNSITDNTAFSPTVTATYTVIGTNVITTCTNTATRSVVVHNLPPVTASASNPVICLNNTTTVNGGGALTYTWTNGVTNAVAFSPSASNIYTVSGTDANTCTNTAVVSVTVNPLPVVTAGSTHSFVCIGSSVVLSGGGASTYTWTGGVTDGVAFAPVSTSNYTVTGTDLNTCTNTAVTTVTVYNNAPVTANTTSAVICAGDQTTLFGAGAVTFTWTSGVNDNSSFVPSATNSYTVTGTDVNGCLGSAAISVTVNPLPNVSSTVSHSVICMNHTTSVNGAGAVTYQWTGGVTNGVPFSPTSTDNYTVTGTDANGCKNYDTKQIVVNPLPVVTANASNPVICAGDATTLTGGGANFYSWSGGIFDGITFSPMVTTSYTVTGMDLNSCINSAVITITVNNSPTVTASSSPSVICNGDQTTLSGGGASTYVWTGGVSNATPFNPSTSNSYTVIGTAANGCTNSAMTSVTVNALPIVTASTSHSVICLNFTTSVSGGGAVTYIWSGGVINNTPFTPTITDTYSVIGTDANGCQNVAFQTITVNNLPLVSGAATNPVICDGESTTLNGSGAVTYTWTNGVTDGTVFSPTLTLTYQVTGTDANTCTNTAVVTITVNNTPTVTASSSHSVICMNDFTTLNGGGAVSYFWTSNITDGVAFSPTVTNSYTVIGTSAEGCTNSAVTSITVNALPNVTGAATSPSLCIGDITSLHGAGAQIYTWSGGVLNGSAFSPMATAVYTVTGTDVNGCVNTNTTLVTVVQKPTITAAVSQTAVCIGESVIFSGAGATSYTWTNGPVNGTPFTPGFSNSYVVIGSTSGCLSNNTVTLSVTVNTLPIVSVGNGSICSGGSFTLNANGAVTYTFSGGQIVSPGSTSTYSVFGTNAEGCVNITPAIATVTVKALPVILFSATHTKICTGQTATISATGASTYVWNSGNLTSNIVVSPQTNTVYSVVGTDADMCVGSGSIALAVVNMPTVNLISNIAAACRGAEVSLIASGAETYSWNTGDVGSNITSTPVGSTVYIVTGTNEGTCSQTASVSVTIYGIPIVNAGPDVDIQAGETAQLNATQVGASTYSWTTGEGLSSTSILNPVSTIDHDITYTLTVISSRGCSAKDEVTILVSNGLTIANYMSPNGDGKNDTWKISNLYLVKNYSVDVVDSWGKTVFSKADNYANEFDGQDLPDGVYYYFIKDGSKLKFKGSITITR